MSIRILTLSLLAALCPLATAEQVTSTFTYQGRLNRNGGPANGTFDLRFRLYNAATGGAQVGSSVEFPAQAITNGLFSVDLNFGGASIFDGTAYWIATSARPALPLTSMYPPGKPSIPCRMPLKLSVLPL